MPRPWLGTRARVVRHRQLYQAGPARCADRPHVALAGYLLHPGHGPQLQEVKQCRAVERIPAGELEREPRAVGAGLATSRGRAAQLRAQRGRRHAVGLHERRVELADAGEPARERDLGDRHRGLREQSLRGLHPHAPGQCERPGAKLGHQQAAQVPLGDREPVCQPVHPVLVHVPVRDQADRAPGQVGPDVPLRRAGAGLRAAAAARTEPGRLGRARVRVEPHVAPGRGAGRAHRPAVDSRARHGREETPVKPRVAGEHRAVAGIEVERHISIQPEAAPRYWRESDLYAPGRRPPSGRAARAPVSDESVSTSA